MRFALPLLLLAASAQSQPPSPTPFEASQKKQQKKPTGQVKTQADQEAAQEFSPLVEKVAAEIARRSQQRSNNEGFNPSSPDWWEAVFAGFLTIIGAVQVYVYFRQATYMKRGLVIAIEQAHAAKISARAAKESAEAAARAAGVAEKTLLLTERADVLVDGASISTFPNLLPTTVISVVFKNFGRTRANNVQTKVSLNIPNMSGDEPPKLVPTVIAPGDTEVVGFQQLSAWLTKDAFAQITSGEAPLTFHAEVNYVDVFGNPHRTISDGLYMHKERVFSVTKNHAD